MQCICKIVENRELCNDVFEMKIECPEIAREAQPGQFLHLKVNKAIDPLLRRPISISRIYRDTGVIS
ncbi:MAG TPA: dihydroorotate dehydrogenase electron transfer subunit, partial [Bacillota bacterium]|nr:dihydroorotate dehydrogenase electron transfer subunit [Bacillota bacterium]